MEVATCSEQRKNIARGWGRGGGDECHVTPLIGQRRISTGGVSTRQLISKTCRFVVGATTCEEERKIRTQLKTTKLPIKLRFH